MGTRAHIAVEHADKTVTWAYVHYDGYVANTGVLLHLHYNSYEDACRLTDYYSINGITAEWRTMRSPKMSKHKKERAPRVVPSANKIPYCEYVYLWRDGEWWLNTSLTNAAVKHWTQLAPIVTAEILRGNAHAR